MCRLAAYLGPEIPLDSFLLAPPHSLVEQAWNPQELVYAKLNADGFGVGWYADDDAPAVYTSTTPIWSDTNLPHLARSLNKGLWLANVRSATQGMTVNQANTQPFYDDNLLFLHNGFMRDFQVTLRPVLHEFLASEIQSGIAGNTDSEYLFAIIRQLLNSDSEISIDDAIVETFRLVEEWLDDIPALLNVVMSDGQYIYAARHAINEACPSLYYTTEDDNFPNGQLIASERLNDSDSWQEVQKHHILILDAQDSPELIAL